MHRARREGVLDCVQRLLNLGRVAQVDLEDRGAISTGVACTLDSPVLSLESSDDLTAKEASGTSDENSLAGHVESCRCSVLWQ